MRINELQSGMVLSCDLKTSDGRMLLPRGLELTDRHIQMLVRAGIEDVEVDAPKAELNADMVRALEEYVRDFYLYVNPDHAPMLELFRISLDRTAVAVASGWNLPSEEERRAQTVEHMDDIFLKDMGTPADIVKHETELESFPDVYFRIREVLDSPNVSADRLAKVVSTDVGLSAKLLKLVNSPFYGFTSSIDSISRAVALVGGKELSTLALGISTISYFKDIPPELINMEQFWRHSISCGVFARLLAEKQNGLQPERLFIAGLLHDVGRLIMFKKIPYASREAMLFARENSIPLHEAEREVIGFDHTDVSRHLLAEWKFPQGLSEIINYHHDPMAYPNPLEPAIVNVADNIANAVSIAEGGMYVVPGMAEGAWELMGTGVGFLREAISAYDEQIDQIQHAFF
ncbi:HDOD domain-containing protein [Pseudodesulfovibrio senegalensis]|jgi:HD-like signal output (HDOD) protein|uniref:HDOD domain-containing protein n=1 Tax=Pseudodesulfovibrio senegalensis TaxID=1721087 RepID=A0A6N6N069_9BACT|nr:HDOD domain-containing protein [Pseudodesulfovibrio senegalensis]KAB1440889.1 HDOD domain-containing protein [Pseudodesulfovibrio senegalensis]